MELRCHSGILFGVVEDGVIEFTCKSRWCGKRSGVVVLHKFDVTTGKMISTDKFAEPNNKETSNDTRQSSAVRSA